MENGRQSIWKLSSHKICDVSRWFLIRLCFRFLFLLLRYNEFHFIKDLLEKMPFFLFCEHNQNPPPFTSLFTRFKLNSHIATPRVDLNFRLIFRVARDK